MKAIRLNPVVLILINIVAPSMYIFLSGKYMQYYLLIFASLLMICMGCFKSLLGMLIVYFTMMATYYLTIQNENLQFIALFFIVLVQSVPCLGLAMILIRKYNSAQLLSALESLHLPRVIVIAVTITLKYIPTFKREFSYILESMRLRGINFSMKHPIKSFQYFIVPQLFRCAALAEEVTAAGYVKGIDVPVRRTSYFEEKIRIPDVAVLTIFVAGLVGGFAWKAM